MQHEAAQEINPTCAIRLTLHPQCRTLRGSSDPGLICVITSYYPFISALHSVTIHTDYLHGPFVSSPARHCRPRLPESTSVRLCTGQPATGWLFSQPIRRNPVTDGTITPRLGFCFASGFDTCVRVCVALWHTVSRAHQSENRWATRHLLTISQETSKASNGLRSWRW